MTDMILDRGGHYVKCERDGLTCTFTYSDEPKWHYVLTLRDLNSYNGLKRRLNEIYDDFSDSDEGFWGVCDYMHTSSRDEFFTDDMGYCYTDIRSRDEMENYVKEAWDKVWLMRSRPVDIPKPNHPKYETMAKIERDRQAGVRRILNTYEDIPDDGYTDWECGYWNGILGAIRWALGDEKDSLDT